MRTQRAAARAVERPAPGGVTAGPTAGGAAAGPTAEPAAFSGSSTTDAPRPVPAAPLSSTSASGGAEPAGSVSPTADSAAPSPAEAAPPLGEADADGGLAPSAPTPPATRAATYREVLANREFRTLLSSLVLSIAGDQLSKVALSILIYQRTSSTLLTALTYAISLLPWVVAGPFLSSIADRFPRRAVLIASDLGRAGLIALIALPQLPIWSLIVLLLASAMLNPPFESARSALTPDILPGDQFVLGSGLSSTIRQVGSIGGLLVGGAVVALLTARGAVLIDAGTFLLSAVLIVWGVRSRPLPSRPEGSPWQLAFSGLSAVLRHPRLRAILLMVWLSPLFGFAWEALTVPWAHQLHRGSGTVGLLLGAGTAATAIGAVVMTRAVPPHRRGVLLLPMAVAAPGVLALVLLAPHNLPVALVATFLGGLLSCFTTVLNSTFLQAVPTELRGRAFGVAQGGLQGGQGVGFLVAGALAGALAPSTTIALIGVAGAVLTLAAGLWQPIHSPAPAT